MNDATATMNNENSKSETRRPRFKKEKLSAYERMATVSIEKGLQTLKDNASRATILGTDVSTRGLRLHTFLTKGTSCYVCGISGTFFAVERGRGETGGFHLNLWAVAPNGREVLMTHDHVLARALGGSNDISNSETCCGPCNWRKGKKEARSVQLLRAGPESEICSADSSYAGEGKS